MTRSKKRWLSVAMGACLLSGLAIYPMATRTARADEEHHNPRIHAALDALRAAKEELNAANHDFHGKRKEALDSVDHAIEKLDELKDW